MNDSGPARTGIIIAAYGTVIPEAKKGYAAFERRVRELYPDARIIWAYTSAKIRQRLEMRGAPVPSVSEALNTLIQEGITRVAVQSLHTICGEEYNLARMQSKEHGEKVKVTTGKPLLPDKRSFEKAALALRTYIPTNLPDDEAVVLIGHGSETPANATYAEFLNHARRHLPTLHLGTLSNTPGPETIARQLQEQGIRRAHLMPFLCVPGFHVREDIAGTKEDTWSTILRQHDIIPVASITGCTEHPPFLEIWLDHLKEAMDELDA